MESETIPEDIRSLIQNLLPHLLGRRAQEREIQSFYERLRLVRLSSLIGIVDQVKKFRSKEGQKAGLLLRDTASFLKKFSELYGEENRLREAFEGLSTEFLKLYETMEKDPEFASKLEQLKEHLNEVDQVAEFYEKIAEELNVFKDYVTLLRSCEAI